MSRPVVVRRLGQVDYAPTWAAMRDFTQQRTADTPDEIWLLQHPPVFTLGQAGLPEHILDAGDIPVVKIDRGGQVTYHGPGQVIAYLLFDLARAGFKVRELVTTLEEAVIRLLEEYNLPAARLDGAPGVYVGGAKIAALGLRVRQGRCYHGLSLNVDMALAPFRGINPCGYPAMPVTQLADFGITEPPEAVMEKLLEHLVRELKLSPGEPL